MSDTTFNGDARSVHVLSTPANSTTESTTESLSEHKQSENQRQNHFQIRHFVFAVRFGRIFGNFCNDRPQIKFRPTLKSFKCAFATNFGHENASHLAGSLSEFAWSLFWSDRHTIRATEAVVETISYDSMTLWYSFIPKIGWQVRISLDCLLEGSRFGSSELGELLCSF